jgi:hypothetical protein
MAVEKKVCEARSEPQRLKMLKSELVRQDSEQKKG